MNIPIRVRSDQVRQQIFVTSDPMRRTEKSRSHGTQREMEPPSLEKAGDPYVQYCSI